MSNDPFLAVRQLRGARRAAPVAAPAAMTASPAVAAPTKAEYDALRADLVNTRGQLAALITSLQTAGVLS